MKSSIYVQIGQGGPWHRIKSINRREFQVYCLPDIIPRSEIGAARDRPGARDTPYFCNRCRVPTKPPDKEEKGVSIKDRRLFQDETRRS